MGKDIKKRFTVSLDIDTKDAEKQIKTTVGNIKTILTDMGNASDKMGYFKELVNYIQQVDSALTALKRKNGDAFDSMFNGLDENLKQVMASIFNTTDESMSALDELRNKINVAGKNGAGVKELRNMAEEINSLFAGLGKIEPIDIDENFTGRGNLENRIKILTDSLNNFATVWSNVNSKIQNGFTIGGNTDGEIIPSGSDDVQKKISALKSNIEKYNKILKDIKAGYKAYEDFADGEIVKLDFESTIDGAKELVKAFMEVKSQLDATEEGTIEYYESLSKLTKFASQIAPMQDKLINKDFTEKEIDKIFNGIDLGFIDNIFESLEPEGYLIDDIKTTIKSVISETQKEIDKLQNAPKNISGNKDSDQIISYDELKQKVKEYNDIVEKQDNVKFGTKEYVQLQDELDNIRNSIVDIGSLSNNQLSLFNNIFKQLADGDLTINDVVSQLCDMFQINIPSAIGTAQTEIESFTNDAKNNFNSLTNSIKDTFNYALQIEIDTRNGKSTGKELMNLFSEDGSVSTTQGTDYQVDTDTLVQQAIANLNKNIIMSLHNHSNGDMSFSPSDINSFAKFYYGQGTKINGIIANGIVQTIDFSDISQEIAIKIAQDYQDGIKKMFSAENIAQFASIKDGSIVPTELLNQIQSKDIKKYEEIISELQDAQTITLRQAFEQNGAEFTLKAFNLDNIKELTSYLLDVQQNGQNAIEPVEKLKNLISAIKPEVDLSQFTEVFDKFKNGAIDGTRALNQILDFKTVASDASVVTTSIDQVETKVKEFLALTDKISNDWWFSTSEDNVEIGKYLERLNSAKSELDALGDQGKLTAEQLQQVNNAFNMASSHLNASVSRYTGYGTGTYEYTYQGEYEEQQERADRLASENQELRQQLEEKNQEESESYYDTLSDFQKHISDIKDIGISGMDPNEIGSYLEILNVLYARIKEFHNTDEYNDENLNEVQSLYDSALEVLAKSRQADETFKELRELNDKATISTEENDLNTIIQRRKELVGIAEENGLFDEEMLATQKAITSEIEKRIKIQEPIQSQSEQESATNNTPLQSNDNINESKEIQDLEALRAKLIEVKEAINDKTDAFKDEQVTVDSVVNAEIKSLQLLLDKLDEIVGQINSVNSSFNQLDTKPTENTHYVTDPQGNPITMYRGIHDTYGGLVSNRYHGGTFSTSDIEVARLYAGELGKIEKVLLSMKNPLEIDGNGTSWNNIEYIGDNSDEASQKLHKLNAEILSNNRLLEVAQKISVPDYEEKAIQMGFMLPDETIRAQEINYYTQELAKLKAEKEDIFKDTSNPYGIKTTNEIVELAKSSGHDGVIFKDIVDGANENIQQASTVMVTFTQDQIHYIETIGATFESAINFFKTTYGDLTKYINLSSDEIQNAITDIRNFRQELNDGLITNDEYETLISTNPLLNSVFEIIDKGEISQSLVKNGLDGRDSLGDVNAGLLSDSIETFISTMRERLQKIATTFGMEDVPLDKLATVNDNNDMSNVSVKNTEPSTKNPSNDSYALDKTVVETNRILGDILTKLGDNSSFSEFLDPLKSAVEELKNVASGIVEHQKKQKTDYTAASSKIANNYGQLSSIATNTVSSLGDEVQIKQMKALADDVVRVEGAVKNADGVWKGFVVDINESNNAVIHAIDEQSTFAKSLNETAESAKKVVKEAGPQDKFTQSLSAQKSAFNEYRKNLEDVDYLNDELIDGLEELAIRLQSVSNADSLEDWKDDFGALKDEISVVQGVFNKIETEKIKEIRGELNSEFKTLDFTTTTSDPTDEQQEILDLRKQLLTELEKEKEAIKDGKEVEVSSLNEIMSALRQKISLYREANDLESGSKQKFGSTATLNATAKYNSLKQQANSGEFASSSVVQQAFQQYEEAYNRLIAKRKELSKVEGELTDTQKSEFKQLQTECNDYAKILNKIITDSKKLEANSVSRELLGEDFDDSMDGRKAALKDFVEETYGASATIGEFKDNFNKLTFTVDNGDGTFTEMTATINTARTAIDATAGTAKKATTAFESFFNELKGKFKSISAYLISSFSIQEVWQQIRRGVEYVREIDSALTELKKVTDETDETYQKFLQTASKTASVIGSNVADFTNATADFARLGYSIEEASQLAEAAGVYKNVGDGIDDIATASESIISTMKAFGVEAEDAMGIVDRFNEVGNNFAISSTGIGEAMQRSASALYEAGNTIDESIALITGANSVIQNPEQVGTALKTLALRLRGTKTELEEAGLETDAMAESTSQLQAKLKALTHGKVDIMIDANTFKNTTEILREMSDAWSEMTDIERASALELMGGKRQANILASVITNFQTVEDVIKTSSDASGSAMAENEKYLDSIQGKIDQFTNSLQTFWMDTINSKMVKGIVDFGRGVIELVDRIGLLTTALAGVALYFTAFKKNNPVTLFKDLSANAHNYSVALKQIEAIQSLNGINGTTKLSTEEFNSQNINAYAASVSNLTAKQQASALASAGLTQAQIQEAMAANKVDQANIQQAMSEANVATAKTTAVNATVAEAFALTEEQTAKLSATASNWLLENSSKQLTLSLVQEAIEHGVITPEIGAEIIAKYNLAAANTTVATTINGITASIKAMMASNPVGWIMLAISAIVSLVSWIRTLQKSNEKLIQQADEIKNAYKQEADTIQSNISTIQSLEEEFNQLSSGVDDYGRNISLATDDYERYKEIVNQLVGISPSLVKGYDEEGNALANKNGLLQESIKLMQDEQRIKAQGLVSDENLDKLKEGVKAEIDSYKAEHPLPYGNAKYDFMKEFESAASKYASKERGNYEGEIYNALNPGNKDLNDFWTEKYWGKYGKHAGTFAKDYYEQIVEDLRSNESILKDYFTEEQIKNLLEYAAQYDKNIATYNNTIESTNKKLNSTLQIIPLSLDSYYGLTDEVKGYLTQYINGLDVTTDNFKEKVQEIIDLTNFIANNEEVQSTISIGFKLNMGQDENGKTLIFSDYQKQIKDFKKKIQDSTTYTNDQKNILLSMFGLDDSDSMDNEVDSAVEHVKGLLKNSQQEIIDELEKKKSESNPHLAGIYSDQISEAQKEINDFINSLSISDLFYIKYKISADPNSLTIDELKEQVRQLKAASGEGVISVKTYSELVTSIEAINEVLSQTEEIIANNTEVTQEYKDSLTELGISEEDLSDCFYENNKLVVKNADRLRQLISAAKTSISTQTTLARAQARLKYKELFAQLHLATVGLLENNEANKDQINTLYQEMSAVQKVIARYALLEQQLSSVTRTYTEFEEAQTTDSDYDYMSKAEDMLVAAIQAYQTGELGTETAKVVIPALVPEFVLNDSSLETVDQQAEAAHKYIMETLNKYFKLTFDEDTGEIESAEMLMGNVRKFIEDGLNGETKTGMKIFEGEDWMHFEWSEEFLTGLEKSDDKLQYFADQWGITKEVALAAIQEINNHDIEWLGGDYGSLFDQIVPETLDSKLQTTITRITELDHELANGKITQKEYEDSMYGLNGQIARSKATQEECNKSISELNHQLATGAITQEEYDSAVQDASEKLEQARITSDACNETIAELNKKLADGKITQEEYARQVDGVCGQLEQQQQAAYDAATSFMSLNDKIDGSKKKIEDYQEQLASGEKSDGTALSEEEINALNDKYVKELKNYEGYLKQKQELENKYGPITEYTVSYALESQGIDVDDINDELVRAKELIQGAFNSQNFQNVNDSLNETYGVLAKINDSGNVEYSITDKTSEDQKNTLKKLGALNDDGTVDISLLYGGLTDDQKNEVDKLGSLQEKLNLINYYLSMDGVDTVQTAIDNLTTTLNNIYELLATSPIFSANVEDETKTTLDNLLDKVSSWVGNHVANFISYVKERNAEERNSVEPETGMIKVNGTAHATGNFGLPSSEHNALVGELGTELVWNIAR